MTTPFSVDFFDRQFRHQLAAGELALNPFESAVLPWLHGEVLDLGCGLGNLSLHLARRGQAVHALDGSAAAVRHLQQVARAEGLPLTALQADLRRHDEDRRYDSVVSIGLLMFFDCTTARRQLEQLGTWVRPGGVAAINVLTQGTTYTDMFGGEAHCLFAPGELADHFDGWTLLLERDDRFDAPHDTCKRFSTVVARRPG